MLFKQYHFHLYFNSDQLKTVESVVQEIKKDFDFDIGRIWDRPVGPHPIGSCQVTVPQGQFEKFSCWLMQNRQGLDVFIHAVDKDDLKDHTEYVMWMGKEYDLNLDMFK